MAKLGALSSEDLETIEEWSTMFDRALEALEKAKQFSMGDFLVLYTANYDNEMKQEVNSYGAPTKYVVVHVNSHGIPFVKKTNKNGTAIGHVYSVTGSLESDDYIRRENQRFEFRMDPDYADALLLEDQYDPAQLHKSKQEIFKAVTKHNKEVKLNTGTLQDVIARFHEFNVGDTIWTSATGFYLIHDKQTMTRLEFKLKEKDLHSTLKGPFIIVLTMIDKKGKTKKVTADFFVRKALYKERPRTYGELKI